MDNTHIRWLEESLGKNTVQKILKAENRRIGKDQENMTENRNQRELLWFQTGGALIVSRFLSRSLQSPDWPIVS
jgi:hypothetical protein